jgi:hypothetical protein
MYVRNCDLFKDICNILHKLLQMFALVRGLPFDWLRFFERFL